MKVTVHFFARARDLAGRETVSYEVASNTTVQELRRQLEILHPALAGILPRCALAVNNGFVKDAASIPPDAEIAVLPPVSGGVR
jgi:molybdopterin converting factor subunit 1